MKILVTGAAGFIGSQLAKQLLHGDHDLILIDNFHNYYSRERKQLQINSLKSYGEFTFYEVDLLDESAMENVFQQHEIETVIHLAALPGVPYSFQQPFEYVDVDIKATIQLLRLAGEAKVDHVLFASSSSVYGNCEGPVQEDDMNGQVLSPYAAAKVSAESYCWVYQQLYDFQLTILRFFTVYGPWGRPDMAIPTFIRKLEQGKEIETFGEGTARDYTYIDDVVQGIHRAMIYSKGNEVYNIGSGQPITLEELIEMFGSFYPELRRVKGTYRTGDVRQTWSDITKAKQKLGYKPSMSMKEGLWKTIEWSKAYEQ